MTKTDTSAPRRFRLSRLQLALLGSLCLNVVLGSYVATQWLTPRPLLGVAAAAPGRLVDAIAGRLPGEDAGRLRRIFESKKPALTEAQAAFDQSLRQAILKLGDPRLDGRAFRAAVMEARDKRVAVGDIVIEAVIEAAVEMSPQTREALVGRLRNR